MSGQLLPPAASLKWQKQPKGEQTSFLLFLLIPSCFSQFSPLYNVQLCEYSLLLTLWPPLPARVLSPHRGRPLLTSFVGSDISSRTCPGRGRCTLPEWMTDGPLENPVKVNSTFFPKMRAVDPRKAFSESPGPLDPYALRMRSRNLTIYRMSI